MQLEVFQAADASWSWRTKINGRITASAHGYNLRWMARRAIIAHVLACCRLAGASADIVAIRRKVRYV